MQSSSMEQVEPLGHSAQVPPQSTSVSLPFLAPSSQAAIWQWFELQTPLAQSLA